ncbi:MAG: hypothetical protein LBB43_06030 [Spirochaetaceae bacterium]|jgi:hypothetical protein|nr:hypothetical protein [Spirochaetaceae bacterium]
MSWVEAGGQALNGTAFVERTLALYRNEAGIQVQAVQDKAGKQSLIITTDEFPTVTVRATQAAPDGRFYLSSLSFLCSSNSGWNEWTMKLSGTGVFQGRYVMALHINNPIEPKDITEGKILYNTKRLIGEDALKSLKSRRDRILVLIKWMHEQPEKPTFTNRQEFESYWRPIVLPELAAAKQRPQSWNTENAVFEQAEDIKWNTTYTASVFHEELWTLRNSGSLLRDWEEAGDWIYFQYRWDDLVQVLTKDYNVAKLKG